VTDGGARLLPPRILEPTSSCRSCIESLDDLEWRASSTFQVGEWALGVRSSTIEIDAAFRRIIAAHLVDVDAPANFSALLADHRDGDPGPRGFSFLYRASDPLVRTRTPRRLVRALINHLSDFAEPATAFPKVAATAFVVDGRAIFAPERVRIELAQIETRLNAAGMTVVDAPVLHVDPVARELVVPEPTLAVDTVALADFDLRHGAVAREPDPVAPGRYPIAAWSFHTDAEQSGPIGAASAVAAAAHAVVNPDAFGAQRVLDDLAALFTETPAVGIWWTDAGELVRQLLEAAGGAP
jgi:hypothetical protein